jgi:hypothetical protein
MARAIVSAPPPAAKAIISLIGPLGFHSANAPVVVPNIVTAAIAADKTKLFIRSAQIHSLNYEKHN